MDTVRWQIINSSTAELEINYAQKFAKIRLEDLVLDPNLSPEDFYKKCLAELFAAINAKGTYWTDRP
ncbi:hypothetical protein [Pseudomonas migulae]